MYSFFLASSREVQAGIQHRLGDSRLITTSGQELAEAIIQSQQIDRDLLSVLPEAHSQRLSQLLVQYSGESLGHWETYCDLVLHYHKEQRIQALKSRIRELEALEEEHLLGLALAELQSLIHDRRRRDPDVISRYKSY